MKPANISHEDILEAIDNNLTHKQRTTNAQLAHKQRITSTHRKSVKYHTGQGLEQKQSTSDSKYENKYIREHGNKDNHSFSVSNTKKEPQKQTTDEWLEDWEQYGMDSMR